MPRSTSPSMDQVAVRGPSPGWRLVLILLLAMGLQARAQPTMDPGELRPGDRGYGLSVFKGTAIERFEVEVLGVVRNVNPGRDLILIRCSGAGLEHSKLIAGMSGSPIYVGDRLIGALSRGWAFSSDPIGGVTPIRAMLADLSRPEERPTPAQDPPGLKRLVDPLAIHGVSERVLAQVRPALEAAGWAPVPGLTSLTGGSRVGPTPPAPLAPGSAVAVQMIRGDIGASAIGTVTWRRGDQVLAFGHPMGSLGVAAFPAGPAEIVAVLPRVELSMKVGQAIGEEGSMVFDGSAGIVLDTARRSTMIPVEATVSREGSRAVQHYRVEVARNARETPTFLRLVLLQVLEVAGGSSDDVTATVVVETRYGNGRSVRLQDSIHAGRAGFFGPGADSINPMVGKLLDDLLRPLGNSFERLDLDSVRASITTVPRRQSAVVRRAWVNEQRLKAGAMATVFVELRPFGEPGSIRALTFRVPDEAAGQELEVKVAAGPSVRPEGAPPERLDDLLELVRTRYTSRDLVLVVGVPGRALQYRGRVLRRLPACVLPLLDAPNTSRVLSMPLTVRAIDRTPWVLEGECSVRVPVKEVAIE